MTCDAVAVNSCGGLVRTIGEFRRMKSGRGESVDCISDVTSEIARKAENCNQRMNCGGNGSQDFVHGVSRVRSAHCAHKGHGEQEEEDFVDLHLVGFDCKIEAYDWGDQRLDFEELADTASTFVKRGCQQSEK